MEKTVITAVAVLPRGSAVQPAPHYQRLTHEDLRAQRDHVAGMGENDDETELDGTAVFTAFDADGDIALEKDPHMVGDPDENSEDEADAEIRATDDVFACTTVSDQECSLELQVYASETGALWTHHETLLPAYPLCLDVLASQSEVFGIIGMINGALEVYDLRDVDTLEAKLQLGEPGKKSKKRVSTSKKAHNGAVMCVEQSPSRASVVISGGADDMVKLWDAAASQTAVHSYKLHTDKVQAVRWHPSESNIVASAGFDQRVAITDLRQPERCAALAVPGEAEVLHWTSNAAQVACSTEDGWLICADARKLTSGDKDSAVLWREQVHSKACTGFVFFDDCVVTTCIAEEAKVWQLGSAGLTGVCHRRMGAGPLFNCCASPDRQGLVVIGSAMPIVWELGAEEKVQATWPGKF